MIEQIKLKLNQCNFEKYGVRYIINENQVSFFGKDSIGTIIDMLSVDEIIAKSSGEITKLILGKYIHIIEVNKSINEDLEKGNGNWKTI